jgi:formylglycine-generating enzyme required for sulfatase activity
MLAALCGLTSSFKPGPKQGVFTLKKFEKRMALVRPGLYACKYEATNLEYGEFLAHLSKKGDPALLDKARVHADKWASEFVQYGEPFRDSYHQHPAYESYPVVNVSHEGAAMFCDWLTEQYNAYPKREFKQVKFRLPTDEEWLAAARAGNERAIFPWGGYYLRNSNGEYLANFRRISEHQQKRIREDGLMEISRDPIGSFTGQLPVSAHITAPVGSFLPNDFGIHNLSGNAAEMLAEPGRTRGGSWRSYGYYLRLDAEDEYAGFAEPAPMIGFRYFMEVVVE